MAVANTACNIAQRLHIAVNQRELIRGALLHDYYLYDWHVSEGRKNWHGYRHPGIALKNAQQDVELTMRERNIIQRHMFPLTPVPPKYKEAWIVCLADKLCALRETFSRK